MTSAFCDLFSAEYCNLMLDFEGCTRCRLYIVNNSSWEQYEDSKTCQEEEGREVSEYNGLHCVPGSSTIGTQRRGKYAGHSIRIV